MYFTYDLIKLYIILIQMKKIFLVEQLQPDIYYLNFMYSIHLWRMMPRYTEIMWQECSFTHICTHPKNLFTMCCLISTPSFLPTNRTPSSSTWGRLPSPLANTSPLWIPILCSTTQATTYTAACGGSVAISWCRHWNRLFKIPNVCSTRTLVLHKDWLNLFSASVLGFRKGVNRNLLHG